jgi:hypothetical protein
MKGEQVSVRKSCLFQGTVTVFVGLKKAMKIISQDTLKPGRDRNELPNTGECYTYTSFLGIIKTRASIISRNVLGLRVL